MSSPPLHACSVSHARAPLKHTLCSGQAKKAELKPAAATAHGRVPHFVELRDGPCKFGRQEGLFVHD